ncbi:diacylglyceryl transferase [Mucilaginibacter limnophilus]|uniref:Diacylglyceryl transferase n=1 Tax=Mucilaginibacter limnophilus TaxID=1932778 RepID=A0A3S2VA91_9SPHI|nr:prolipoprotein diacylglyceryl transferase family protein [Mucilaginibacter limnophilus]RVU02612.1 diacylglyceryl transferase [Mucilaginibacter limnophilus]
MFPTISDLTEYLFRVKFPIPVYTFGFFVALAFISAYKVFVSEFKRKEREGLIHAFQRNEITGLAPRPLEIAVNALLGFVLSYKLVYIIINYKAFSVGHREILFSIQGNWITGIAGSIIWGYWIYRDRKKEQLSVPRTIKKVVHPYQLMPLIVFSVGFWGFIGAKLFHLLENWNMFIDDPVRELFSANGFTYYGGLTFGALSYLYIGFNRGMKLVHLADIGSPGMMLAYGIGRIGCHLSGDGDWGIVNHHPKPDWLQWLPDWAWSYNFPHNVIEFGVQIKNCFGNYCYQLPFGVYPTSLYEAVICIGLFAFLWFIRRSLTIPGLMFSLYLILNGLERFLIEQLRVNNKYKIGAISITQAEIIGLLMMLGGLTGLVIIGRNLIMYRQKASTNL